MGSPSRDDEEEDGDECAAVGRIAEAGSDKTRRSPAAGRAAETQSDAGTARASAARAATEAASAAEVEPPARKTTRPNCLCRGLFPFDRGQPFPQENLGSPSTKRPDTEWITGKSKVNRPRGPAHRDTFRISSREPTIQSGSKLLLFEHRQGATLRSRHETYHTAQMIPGITSLGTMYLEGL